MSTACNPKNVATLFGLGFVVIFVNLAVFVESCFANASNPWTLFWIGIPFFGFGNLRTKGSTIPVILFCGIMLVSLEGITEGTLEEILEASLEGIIEGI